MITVHHAADVTVRDWLLSRDPFQLALPCWNRHTTQLLPPEHRRITIEELNNMPIRVVPAEQAPGRLHGKARHNQDYQDVLAAIQANASNKGIALVVNMTAPEWTAKNDKGIAKYEKPEITFAYMLRRHFAVNSLALTAYQSGKMEVTVKRDAAVAPKKK